MGLPFTDRFEKLTVDQANFLYYCAVEQIEKVKSDGGNSYRG